jgi:integrase
MVFEEFIRDVCQADKTKRIYRATITKWSGFAGFKDPDELTQSVKNWFDAQNGKNVQGRTTDPYAFLRSIVAELRSKNRASITVLQGFYQMKKFLEYESECALNGIKLQKLIDVLPDQRIKSTDGVPTDEETLRLIHHSNLRGRVALVLALSTGMRVGEVSAMELRWMDFNSDPVRITIPSTITKTRMTRTVFTTGECKDLILQYVGDRRTGYLFPSLEPKKDSPDFKKPVNERGPVSASGISNAIARNLEKTGLRDKITQDSPMHRLHFHSFRKWFYSKAISSGMAPNYAEILMGHSIGLDSHYLRALEQTLPKEYKKIESGLTFLTRENGKIKKTVEDQAEEIKKLQEQVAKLEAVYSEKLKIKEN